MAPWHLTQHCLANAILGQFPKNHSLSSDCVLSDSAFRKWMRGEEGWAEGKLSRNESSSGTHTPIWMAALAVRSGAATEPLGETTPGSGV